MGAEMVVVPDEDVPERHCFMLGESLDDELARSRKKKEGTGFAFKEKEKKKSIC